MPNRRAPKTPEPQVEPALPRPRVPRTAEEFALLPTRARLTVPLMLDEVTPLTWPDGAEVHFVLQAVSLEDEMAANRAAHREGQKAGIGYCDDTYALEYLLAFIVEPHFDRSQLQALRNANPRIVDWLMEQAEKLSVLPPRLVEAELEQLAGIRVPSAEGEAP